MTQVLQDWPTRKPSTAEKHGATPGKASKPPQEPAVEAYWQEWTPEDPLPNHGYCTQAGESG